MVSPYDTPTGRMERSEFNELVIGHLEEVTAFAHYLTDTDWEAEDLVQATYEKAFDRWETLSSRGSCRSWLFRIARNQWIDWMRSREAGPQLELVEDPDDPHRPKRTVSPTQIETLNDKHVRRALQRLPQKFGEVVVLCDIWGFSYDEIADIVDIPMGTVRSRISRGRSRFADVISGNADEVERDS